MKTQTSTAWRVAIVAVVLLAGLALVTAAWAQVSPNYDLSWHVVAGGGLRVASSGHVVQSTVGQFAVGPAGSTHAVSSGYWYGMRPAAGYAIYLPLVLRNYTP